MRALIVGLLFFFSAHAHESIKLFESAIAVHKDSSIRVRETITVAAEGVTIRHGIVREFPTKYQDKRGRSHYVGFAVNNVLLDGKKVAYRVEDAANGKMIFIGDRDIYLAPGVYTYAIEYTTNRQLGFFEKHDELYWNVTGNGWRLPIEKVLALVRLPDDIPTDRLTLEAYTGAFGAQGKAYSAHIVPHGAEFATTQPLQEFEGLTIVVTWPKGYVPAPTWSQQAWWFLQDYFYIAWFFLGLLILGTYYFFVWYKLRKARPDSPIIPLFYPPDDMLPGAVRYFTKMDYDGKVLAADVVNMAVHGWLTIDYEPKIFKETYTLKKKERKETPVLYADIFDTLFKDGDELVIKKTGEDDLVQSAVDWTSNRYNDSFKKYFKRGAMSYLVGIVIAILIFVGFLWQGAYNVYWLMFVYFGIVALARIFIKGYTYEGWLIYNQIAGFKLFLETTETERLKIVGTPPTKTPELYETYLPYAIALGVEEAWSRQFAPIFEKLKQEGHPYAPIWYVGAFDSRSFASSVGNSLSSVISSSVSMPGGSSGSGGGGSSGGGGGGGGGGGW